MRSQSLAVNYLPKARENVTLALSRATLHGGMVGEMLRQIDEHMSAPSPVIAVEPRLAPRVDMLHIVSIMAGYVGLVCGFGTAALIVGWWI